MRKLIFALAMTLCLLSTFTIGASAHTTSVPHRIRPNATGGGCGDQFTSSQGDISASSCIGLDQFDTLNGDAYVTFRPLSPYGVVDGCIVQMLILSNHGQYPGLLQQNCTAAAINRATDAHFGRIQTSAWQYGDNAITLVNIKLTYHFGHVSVLNNVLSRRIYL